MKLREVVPQGLRTFVRSRLRDFGFDIVRLERPGGHDRYPYANLTTFLEDLKARGFRPGQLLDVGANVGAWSTKFATVFPNVSSLLVEPQEELSRELDTLCRLHEGWRHAPVGAAGKNEIRRFKAFPDTVSSSFSFAADELSSKDEIRELKVMTLEALRDQYIPGTRVDVIKLDVEGLEFEVIDGSRNLISESELIIMEVPLFRFQSDRPTAVDLFNIMSECGFSLYDFTMFYRRSYDGALALMDCAFVSDSSPLRESNAWR